MFFNFTSAKAFAFATSILLVPAAAQAHESFERDGVTYTYKAAVKDDRTVITGKASDNKPFRLVVSGDTVLGWYNGKPTRFSLDKVERQAVASR